jgi:DNA-binding LacI/PurR family transcriptional regulator
VVDHLVALGHRDTALVSAPGTRADKGARTSPASTGRAAAWEQPTARPLVERVDGRREHAVQTGMTPWLVVRSSTGRPHAEERTEADLGTTQSSTAAAPVAGHSVRSARRPR